MNILNFDKYSSLFKVNEIADICKPLFDNTEIDYFLYLRIYLDGSRVFLSTHSDFIKWSYKNKYFVTNSIHSIQPGTHLIKSLPKYVPVSESNRIDAQIAGAYQYFNINFIESGIDLIFKNNSKFYEIFEFASSNNKKPLLDFYINNLDVLNHFALYFKDKAKKIIKLAGENRLGVKSKPVLLTGRNDKFIEPSKLNFYQATKLKTIPVGYHNKDIYLSGREIECLVYLIIGHSAKETAKILTVSPKTVEFYIDSAKQKLNCSTKSELIKKIIKLNVISHGYLCNFIN